MTSAISIPPDTTRRESALRFLVERVNYERWRDMPYDPRRLGLDRMRQLLVEIGSPDRGMPIVHVAGTKGKGSTAAMIASVLSAAGYRTGLYTSPHLERIEERIAIDGQPCDSETFATLVDLVRPAVEAMDRRTAADDTGPTFFEIITAMAFLHFRRQNAQAAVLEVGLGGRLDATNVCQPAVSVITSISYDHTQQLGTTLAAIAGEKAGIIKPGVPVVSGVVDPEPREVIRAACETRGCTLTERDRDFDFRYEPPRHLERAATPGKIGYRDKTEENTSISRERTFDISLPGRHQAANAATAIASLDILRRSGWTISDAAIQDGLRRMQSPARVEIVARRPVAVVDAAHNVASIDALLETLDESFSVARRLLIFGTTQDKDVRGMLARLLGRFDEVYFTRYANNARGVSPEELQKLAIELTGKSHTAYEDAAAAWMAARAGATADDLICITGSFFLAAEMKNIVNPTTAYVP